MLTVEGFGHIEFGEDCCLGGKKGRPIIIVLLIWC